MIQDKVLDSVQAVNQSLEVLQGYDSNQILARIMKEAFTFQTLVCVEGEIQSDYTNPGVKAFFHEFHNSFDEVSPENSQFLKI